MKELFKNYRSLEIEPTEDQHENGFTPKSFESEMSLLLDDEFEDDYFLVSIPGHWQDSEEYVNVFDKFESTYNAAQMVGEFIDGRIEEGKRQQYLIFRVEAK